MPMHHLQMQCPHCKTERASFRMTGSVPLPSRKDDGKNRYLAMLMCSICHEGVLIRYANTVGSRLRPEQSDTLHYYEPEKVYPESIEHSCPEHVPDNIKSFFLQGLDNIDRRNFDAAGMMFRKVIDATTINIGASGQDNLYKRIKNLADSHVLTQPMAEWAHQVRLDGNDAAHGDTPFSQSSAEMLKDFTELLLMYIYSLPGMLSQRRGTIVSDSVS